MKCPICNEAGVIENPDEEEFDAFDPEEPPWGYGCRHCGYAWSEKEGQNSGGEASE